MMTDSQRASNAEIVAIVNLYGHIADSKVWKEALHQSSQRRHHRLE